MLTETARINAAESRVIHPQRDLGDLAQKGAGPLITCLPLEQLAPPGRGYRAGVRGQGSTPRRRHLTGGNETGIYAAQRGSLIASDKRQEDGRHAS